MENDIVLNEHNKEEFPPAHTAEHLLNQTMIRLFGCGRSFNAHVERKKSKMSFRLDHKPTRQEEKEIERRMNELIADDLPVTFEFVSRDELPEGISLEKLPDDASDTLLFKTAHPRIVSVEMLKDGSTSITNYTIEREGVRLGSAPSGTVTIKYTYIA